MTNKKIYQILFTGLLLLAAAVPHVHAAQQLYVAPDGNDAWSGRLTEPNAGRSDGPLASLYGARLKVRERIQKGFGSPLTVLIRCGEYSLSETVVLTN